jgi:hypothetical protein
MTARSARAQAIASNSLLAATALLPIGFFLGGASAEGGDPGAGVALVPVGGLLLVVALVMVARLALQTAAEQRWRKP